MKLFHLYGLAVASDFDCPELSEITPEQAAAQGYQTVELVRATAPLTLPEGRQLARWLSVTRDACLYQFDGIARMLIERPDRITVEMLPGGVESDMRAYLFGTGFGTLMHMRGLVPLHISAIQSPEGVVAYTGQSGAGKSTTVANLHFRNGWPIICDDVAVLHPGDDTPLLHAGMNRIKLWKDAVERLGIEPSRLMRDMTREDKFHLNAPEMFVAAPQPLRRLIEIGSDPAQARQLSGAEAFATLRNCIYRPEIAALFADSSVMFSHLARVAHHVTIEIGVVERDRPSPADMVRA